LEEEGKKLIEDQRKSDSRAIVLQQNILFLQKNKMWQKAWSKKSFQINK